MCGLFGFCGTVPNQTILASALCVLNESRGPDSVGVASIDSRHRKAFKLFRRVGAPCDIVPTAKFQNAISRPCSVLIGHTRFKTHGAVLKANAHPFHIGNTVGAHNGVVTNLPALASRCGRSYDVDSQYLIHLLDRENAIGEISGSAALTFTQLKSAADLSLIRWHNPLHVAEIGDMKALVWSSELSTLKSALAIAQVTEYTVWQFDDCKRWNVYLTADNTIAEVTAEDAPIKSVYTTKWKYLQSSGGSSAWEPEPYRQAIADDDYAELQELYGCNADDELRRLHNSGAFDSCRAPRLESYGLDIPEDDAPAYDPLRGDRDTDPVG